MKSLFNLTKIAAGALIAIGLSIPSLADTKTSDSPAGRATEGCGAHQSN